MQENVPRYRPPTWFYPVAAPQDGRLREHALSASGETRRTAQTTRCSGGPGIPGLGCRPKSVHCTTEAAKPAAAESESAVRLIVFVGCCVSVQFFSDGDCHWPCHRRRCPCPRKMAICSLPRPVICLCFGSCSAVHRTGTFPMFTVCWGPCRHVHMRTWGRVTCTWRRLAARCGIACLGGLVIASYSLVEERAWPFSEGSPCLRFRKPLQA